MSNLNFWRDALWREVERIYRPDRPLYLSFDANFLRRSLDETSHEVTSQDEAVELFNNDCADLFHIGNSEVSIKPGCFDATGPQGRSLCIVIAAQQILAAEMMVGDEIYSADSYYARYRDCLGVRTDIGKLPFDYKVHRRIWNVLKRELLCLPQADDRIITFGEGRGNKNKYRNFPLSQALLDEESLRRIFASKKQLSALSKEQLIFWLRSDHLGLALRAKKKLRIESLHEGIYQQIKSFSVSEDQIGRIKKDQIEHQEELRLVPEDILLEESVIGFNTVLRIGFREVLPSDLRSVELQRLLDRVDALSMVQGQFSGWIGAETVGRDTIHPDADYVLLHEDNELCSNFRKVACEGLPPRINLFIVSALTALRDKENHKNYTHSMRFVGGICLDELRGKYLCGHPPTKLLVGELEIHSAELVSLDGVSLKLRDAFLRMADAGHQTIFNIEARKKNKELQFWATKDSGKARYGHKILGDQLQLKPELVGQNFSYFECSGFDQSDLPSVKAMVLSESELISYAVLPDAYWLRVRPVDVKHSLDQIGDSTAIRRKVVDRIRRTCALPGPLLKKLSQTVN